MTTMGLFLSALCVLSIGALVSAFHRNSGNGASRFGAGVSVAGALLSLWPAISVLRTGQPVQYHLPWSIPFGTFYISIDPLSALFLVIITVGCLLAAVYGIGYLAGYEGRKHLGAVWCFFNLLFASMLLIVTARNGVLFIMAWEGMSLSSFFLVMFEHEKSEVREAGWIYITAAHLGAACLLALFVLMGGGSADLDFDHLALSANPSLSGVLFVLAILGFGAKAGFLPLHVWLPEAHPAAPSHVSAVMSGIMIKTGIYGLVRIISLIGPPPAWWGWTLLGIGIASGIIGVLSAIAQHDLKRLLAYSSIENIGIICLGLGGWLLGIAAGQPELAALGLLGGLLHACNHSLFKSLLFLGAGAIKHATHTLQIDRLGGLQKRMPKTALAFLIGTAAICGLPPLNGFVGEFLIYLGAFGALTHAHGMGNLGAGGLLALLSMGLIGGLSVVCFTRAYGIIFSGEPRSMEASGAREITGLMWLPMAVLAALCILLGLAAPLGVALVAPVATQLLGESATTGTVSMVTPLLIRIGLGGAAIVVISLLLAAFRRRLLSGREVVEGVTWDCGYAFPSSRMQYTASSFAQPVTDMFRWLVRLKPRIEIDEGDFPRQAHLSSPVEDAFRAYLFSPLFRYVAMVAQVFHRLQQGHNQLYVLYIAIAVLALLLLKVR